MHYAHNANSDAMVCDPFVFARPDLTVKSQPSVDAISTSYLTHSLTILTRHTE